ncbi:MAG TPA: DUF47 family protein [Chloroflexota bacterium]|nr:DUF47 family protein [Chloroflexota bacterium]
MVLARFFPHEAPFFDWFEQNSANVVAAARALAQAFDDPATLEPQAARLTELERQADDVTHRVMAALNRTFVTPIHRDDIADLANALDTVVDTMDVALRRMVLFRLRTTSPLARHLAHVVLQQAEAIHAAVPCLRDKRLLDDLTGYLVEINRLENEGDRDLEQALANLFADGADLPALVDALKWKEVYELLEAATDSAEDVADVLESIVLKNA